MVTQYIIIGVTVLAALAYIVWRIRKLLKEMSSPCYGCKGCALREQMMKNKMQKREKPACYDKK